MTGIPQRLVAALAHRYLLERELGAGGMATVYLAEDVKHRRRVAIKVLRPELAAALGAERFLREIETTANLRHPHILPLYDSGEAAGFLFYVMPFVEGESLRDRLGREKQLPIGDALAIAREVADALGYAHARGVVHRDIKPENILLEGGHAVVADFGIARAQWYSDVGWNQWSSGDAAAARASALRAIALDSAFYKPYHMLAWIEADAGNAPAAREALARAAAVAGGDFWLRQTLEGFILARSGDAAGARRVVRAMGRDPHLAQRAMLLHVLGVRDSMYALFERAIDARDADAIWILNSAPFLRPLRRDPRYQPLLERMGLPESLRRCCAEGSLRYHSVTQPLRCPLAFSTSHSVLRMGHRILVVDDERDITALVAYHLAKAGYRVSTASSGPEALKSAADERPDLVVLDLMLPGLSGYEVLQELRRREETREIGVVVLTARREEGDRIKGLELGADDYLVKPFSPQELVLRIAAVLRRLASPAVASGSVLTAGPLVIDRAAHRVAVEGKEIELTATEYNLLLLLAERRGRVQSRSQLLESVWKANPTIQTRTVDMHMQRLRAKLGSAASFLETVRGFGYRFRSAEPAKRRGA